MISPPISFEAEAFRDGEILHALFDNEIMLVKEWPRLKLRLASSAYDTPILTVGGPLISTSPSWCHNNLLLICEVCLATVH
jgi:hypothetical protein